jgi:hypothetical protein
VSTVEKHLMKAIEQCDRYVRRERSCARAQRTRAFHRKWQGQVVTNVVGFEARASVERQAREWLVRMDGDEPLTEAEALREWMRRSVVHREELKRICKFWRQANVLTELAVCLESATEQHSRRSARWATAVALATSAVLAAVILG